MSLLDVRDLRIGFGETSAVHGISFAMEPGSALGIAGESGCGKSLTALALMGLLPVTARAAGRIEFEGQDLLQLGERQMALRRGARLAMVFQDPMTALNPHLRIGTQMAEVLQTHAGQARKAALAECARMLDAVQVPDSARRLRQYPHELSGGQRQRVMIAMALLCRPPLLIADEPTTALDVTVQAELLRLLAGLRREFGMALLLISHDLAVIAELCERLLVMYAGNIVEQGATGELLRGPRHPYTAGLLNCRPGAGQAPGQPLPVLAGQPPRPGMAAPGCAFAPRCSHRQDRCAQEAPLMRPSSGRLLACHHPLDAGRTPSEENGLAS